MKKTFLLCLISVVMVLTSCTSTLPTQVSNKTAQYISQINSLLGKVPTNSNIFSVDDLKGNTVGMLNDVSELLKTSSQMLTKYSNPDTRSSISMMEVLTLVADYESAQTSINNLRNTWNTVNNDINKLNPEEIKKAASSLSFIKDAINIGDRSLNDNIQSLNTLLGLIKGK